LFRSLIQDRSYEAFGRHRWSDLW